MKKDDLPPPVIYRVAELFTHDRLGATEILKKIATEFPALKLSREDIYPAISRAASLRFLRLVPPVDMEAGRRLEEKFNLPAGTVRVVDCPLPARNVEVSAITATWALELLPQLQAKVGGTIGVGLGPGRATLDFSRAFGHLLAQDLAVRKLNLIAISAGCPADSPEYSSISFFNLFNHRNVEKRIGLFAATLVKNKDFTDIQEQPGAKEAFTAKKDGRIHLVVTSMGDMKDPHSLLTIFYANSTKPKSAQHAVGDVQYRPFTAKGFIHEGPEELRAVTLFDLEELVELAKQRDRCVMLIARQCGVCEPPRTRARPLRPLLQNPKMRIFSHLVTDTPTAAELLAE